MSAIWHLAIECSSAGGSVALFHSPESKRSLPLHSQSILPSDQGSVRTLAPAIEQLLRAAHLQVSELTNLSVTVGPGSFTGLRVGLATAKMLGLACRKQIVPVDTLAAIAARFTEQQSEQPPKPLRLVTAINAFRKQVFTASWLIDGAKMQLLRPADVVDAKDWLCDPWSASASVDGRSAVTASHGDRASLADAELWITGSALASYPLAANGPWRLAAEEIWQPLAEQVGRLGWQGYLNGEEVTAHELGPKYIRASAAEEKATARRQE